MADAKITALTELTSVENTDLVAIVDDPAGTPITKKITVDNLTAGSIKNTLVAAKGDIISASANDTPAILSVGANGQVLMADSNQTTGLKYRRPGRYICPASRQEQPNPPAGSGRASAQAKRHESSG